MVVPCWAWWPSPAGHGGLPQLMTALCSRGYLCPALQCNSYSSLLILAYQHTHSEYPKHSWHWGHRPEQGLRSSHPWSSQSRGWGDQMLTNHKNKAVAGTVMDTICQKQWQWEPKPQYWPGEWLFREVMWEMRPDLKPLPSKRVKENLWQGRGQAGREGSG